MKYIIMTIVSILVFTGCVQIPEIPTSLGEQKPDIQYVEFESYEEEVVPKLERNYTGMCQRIRQYQNITPDEFIRRAQSDYRFQGTELVMVDPEIENGMYSFHACYLKKINVDNMRFGAELNPNMPMHLRESFASNKGCTIGRVFYDTPAYYADIHRNDVVTNVNGKEVLSCKHMKSLLDDSSSVSLRLWVNGQLIDTPEIELKSNFSF